MILARRGNYWYLAGRLQPDVPGVAFVAGLHMPREGGFELYTHGTFFHKYAAEWPDTTFFPTLKYQGLHVEPLSWHAESQEPLLKCLLNSSRVSESITEFKDLAKRQREYDQWIHTLKADGWTWDQREGGQKYIHVDDLEKIEGPPPEGAF